MCENKTCMHGHKHDHHGDKDPNSCYGMMRRCGHMLHHGTVDKETAFNALTEEEQTQLKTLLGKLLESWKADKASKPAQQAGE